MVSTVSGSDFITLREPASKNSAEKNTEFKDALHKAEKAEGKPAEEKEQETGSLEGALDEAPAEPGVSNAAAELAGMTSWMGVLWNQFQSVRPVPQTELPAAPAAEGGVQEVGKEMLLAPEQDAAFVQPQAGRNPEVLQQSLPGGEGASVKAPVQEGPETAVQPKDGKTSGPAKETEPRMQPKLQEETAAKEKDGVPVMGEDESRKEKASGAELAQTAGKAAAEQAGSGSRSQGIAESKSASSGSEARSTATVEELPQRILSGIRENRAEFEIQIEPEALGRLTIKASYQEGKAVISILCSNAKTAEILGAHARELGAIMEANLGHPTEVVMDRSAQENQGQDYPDGHAGGRGQRDEESGRRQQKKESDSFLQQLRLGLV